MIKKLNKCWFKIKANVFHEPKQIKNRIIKQIILIFLITSIIPLNYNFFLIAGQTEMIALAPGVSGFIQIWTEWICRSHVQYATLFFFTSFLILNIPIFIFSFKKLGKCLALYTFLIPLFTLIWTLVWQWSTVHDWLKGPLTIKLTDNNFLNNLINVTIYGTIAGTVYGCLLKGGGTTGGFDTIFTYFSLKKQMNFIKTIRIFNVCTIIIFVIATSLVKNYNKQKIQELLILSIYLVFVATFVMGKIFIRFNLINVNIISNNAVLIKETLYKNNFIHGGIIFFGKGLYNSDQNREMITTVISMMEYADICNIIKKTDPNAIIYCTNIHKISQNFISKKYD